MEMTTENMTPLADIAKLATETKVAKTRGVVKALGARTTSKAGTAPWTVQTIVLQDGQTELPVAIWDRDPLPDKWVGQTLWLLAKQAKTTTHGMKVKADDRGVMVLHVTKSAELVIAQAMEPEPLAAPMPASTGEQVVTPTSLPQTASIAPVTVSEQTPPKCRCVEIRYDRTHNVQRYCSESIGITLAVNDGERADEVLAKAKAWVMKRLAPPMME